MELSAKQLRAIERECRAQAREMVKEAYQKYDEVWAGRIRITARWMKSRICMVLKVKTS